MTFIFDPFWGAVSDHVGRKPLQILACTGYTLGWGTVATCRLLPILLAGRALDGVTSCMLPICQASVRDISPPDRLSHNLGSLSGLAIGAAFIVGGMAGGLLTKARRTAWRAPGRSRLLSRHPRRGGGWSPD
jgi:DHA1 family tetracycline resistance protein-like MFS transporter